MISVNQILEDLIATREAPVEVEKFLACLMDSSGVFVLPQEGELIDYKQEWPFSFSDDYFGGIVRLICAFNNTSGGIILFGVHDVKRTISHNRVTPNIEKLNNFLRINLRSPIECKLSNLKTESDGRSTLLLLVPQRIKSGVPNYCIKPIGKYEASKYWVRVAHEVVECTSKDLPLLFGLSQNEANDSNFGDMVLSVLPPSAASIKTFVGRLPSLVQLMQWLTEEDEPRKFLFGRGGSGKTTVAYEFAKIVSIYGAALSNQSGQRFQQVIFLTAKELKLDTKSGRITTDNSLDFSNETELYTAILLLTGWSSDHDVEDFTLTELKEQTKQLLDTFTTLLVIDDIDTLTTKGREAGFEFLFKILSRSKSGSKVLYTMRNAPSQSFENAIEIPGLSAKEEYPAFVSACCKQFQVVNPSEIVRDGKMALVSERRPLIVESLVGLRRTFDTYDRVLEVFSQRGGDDIRRYVFLREWQALPSDNSARHLLLALALLERPAEFEDLIGILQFSEDTLSDTISQIREMFLEIGREAKTLYSVAPLARGFILAEGTGLNKYNAVKTRVEFFRKSYHPLNPVVSRLELKVDRLVRSGDLIEAWNLVADNRLPDTVKLDPRFKSLLCKVAYKQNPPKISDAREGFDDCISMKFEPAIDTMRVCFDTEKNSGIGFDKCFLICDKVINGKNYNIDERGEFLSRKAHVHFLYATDLIGPNAIDSFPHLRDSLNCNFRALHIEIHGSGHKTALIERNIRSGIYRLLQSALALGAHEESLELLNGISNETEAYIDPIVVPLLDYIQRIKNSTMHDKQKASLLGKLVSLLRRISRSASLFYDRDNKVEFERLIALSN